MHKRLMDGLKLLNRPASNGMNTKKIKMCLQEKSYDIQIGNGLLENFNFRNFKNNKYIIIADTNTKKLFGEKLIKNLKCQKLPVKLLSIPSGESSKNLSIAEHIIRSLARMQIDKNATILALGGGVIGDLAGFVASIYKRGIRYIQIPTTLLAQVDSSIGGKTGVNIVEGKNLIGRIYQPLAVLIDPQTLLTLPDKEIKNGLAEIIKCAIIKDEQLFQYLENNIQENSLEFYEKIILQTVKIKVSVVQKDEHEKEFRKILNYGHTIGHAMEIISKHKVQHGEAVALGMVYEGKIANHLGIFNKTNLERQNNLIKKLGFARVLKFKPQKLIEIMKRDKKVMDDKLYFILPKKSD